MHVGSDRSQRMRLRTQVGQSDSESQLLEDDLSPATERVADMHLVTLSPAGLKSRLSLGLPRLTLRS